MFISLTFLIIGNIFRVHRYDPCSRDHNNRLLTFRHGAVNLTYTRVYLTFPLSVSLFLYYMHILRLLSVVIFYESI